MAINFDSTNLKETIAQDKLTVVDFWAEWCGPCKMLSPIIEELSNEMGDTVNIGKVDVVAHQDLSVEYGVRNLPTILFFKNGEIIDKKIGAMSKNTLLEVINSHLN